MKDKIYIVETGAAKGTILLATEELNDFAKQNNPVEYINKNTLLEIFEKMEQDRLMNYILFDELIGIIHSL